MNAQKQDGQTQTTGVVKAQRLRSRPSAQNAGKRMRLSSTQTRAGTEQTACVGTATRSRAKSDGMRGRGLTAGLRETTNMGSPRSFLLICTKGRLENVQYATRLRPQNEDCMLTIATKQTRCAGFFATAAIRELVLCAKTLTFSPRQSCT